MNARGKRNRTARSIAAPPLGASMGVSNPAVLTMQDVGLVPAPAVAYPEEELLTPSESAAPAGVVTDAKPKLELPTPSVLDRLVNLGKNWMLWASLAAGAVAFFLGLAWWLALLLAVALFVAATFVYLFVVGKKTTPAPVEAA